MRARTRRSRGPISLLLASLVIAVGAQVVPSLPAAHATSTLDPNPADTSGVIRDNTLNVKLDAASMGLHYNRNTTGSSGLNFSIVNPTLTILTPCRGDNPAGRDLSPRATVEVSGPNGVVAQLTTPARDYNLLALSAASNPQPAAPGDDIFRGGDVRSATSQSSWTATFNLEGQPTGTYTVTTTTYNRIREANVTNCAVGTPTGAQTWAPGPKVETHTFEYRPWQYSFTDVFGNGTININANPAETQMRVGGQLGSIHKGDQRGFALPAGTTFMLPPDPSACADDPWTCLPPGAVLCDASTGCVPSVIIDTWKESKQELHGVFDMNTGAFIAHTKVGERVRVMASLGRENDARYKDLLTQLGTAAAAGGVDLAALLATRVQVSTGEKAVSLSVLNGLQIDPTTTPAGVQIFTDPTAAAGLILNVYSFLGGECEASSGSSANTADSPDRYTNTAGHGYTVQRSDLLPDVPKVSPADALGIGGPIYHIHGDFNRGSIINMNNALVGVNTLPNEPNGYPVWVEALGLAGSPLLGDQRDARTMDFLGTAMWSASETPIAIVGCLTVDFMLGLGVAVYNSPVPNLITGLPIWTPNAQLAQVKGLVDGAVAQVTDQVTSNPVVADLLDQIVGKVPLPTNLPLP